MESFYGHITSFDYKNARGRVSLETKTLRFCATTWDSGRPRRPPRAGEQVKVLFNDEGQLLSVRALPA